MSSKFKGKSGGDRGGDSGGLRAAGGVKKGGQGGKKQNAGVSGLEFHKSKGQHILKNPMCVQAIVDKSGWVRLVFLNPLHEGIS